MPASKQHQYQRQPSSELGQGDFAITHNARTGRPVRKRRKTSPLESPFVDSAVAVSDPEDSDIDPGDINSETGEYDGVVPIPRVRLSRTRRKRSPSPAMSEDMNDDRQRESDMAMSDAVDEHHLHHHATGQFRQIVVKDLVINVPLAHQGPVMLQLSNDGAAVQLAQRRDSFSRGPGNRRVQRGRSNRHKHAQASGSLSAEHKYAGFMDLPAELRNVIYREAFVADDELRFDTPVNFARSAALLRTCRQIHTEGSSILYGENRFVFRRRTHRSGSYWENEWNEVGFKAIRRFLKTIGPTNIGQIRHVALILEDATPSLNPRHLTIEQRRFVNDEHLISVLRHLADHAELQTIRMCFRGRRRVNERTDLRFLDHLLEIEADTVLFDRLSYPGSSWTTPSKQEVTTEIACIEAMTRKVKLYD